MKLFVIRHGECLANVRGVVAGSQDDSPLTVNGIDEAVHTAEKLQHFSGLIVSSPLVRARKTAEIIRDIIAPGTEIRLEPLFVERNVGDAMGMPIKEYFALEKSGAPIPNAETEQQLFDRVRSGLEKLRTGTQDTLLVSHNGTYRMLVCVLQNLPPRAYATTPLIQNAEVKEFEI